MDKHVNLSNWGELHNFDDFDDSAKFAFLNMQKIEKCMPFVSGLGVSGNGKRAGVCWTNAPSFLIQKTTAPRSHKIVS